MNLLVYGSSNSDDEEEEEEEDFFFLLLLQSKLNYMNGSFRRRLSLEGRRKRDRRLPRAVLLHPWRSPWQKIRYSGDDQSMITVTGFDCDAFNKLLNIFKPYYYNYTPWTGDKDGTTYMKLKVPYNERKSGRKRIIKAHAALGLVLTWYRFRGAAYILQGWFGFTGSHANTWLRFSRRMLLKALKMEPSARVAFPDANAIEEYKKIVKANHSMLRDVYSTADGLKLHFEEMDEEVEQGKYYNGWTHGHYVTNLFCFGADGRIIKCAVNIPGSQHDSTIAEWCGFYDKLEQVFNETGGKCCVDSAFCSVDRKYIIKSGDDLTMCKSAKDIGIQRQATSLRQASEWGMRAIQSAFPRLKDTIHYEKNGERVVILKLVPLLYNFRLEEVGLNQIRNVYCSHWSKDAADIVKN